MADPSGGDLTMSAAAGTAPRGRALPDQPVGPSPSSAQSGGCLVGVDGVESLYARRVDA